MTAAFLIYILKWALVLSLLYSLFGFALRRETFHGFNRVVLLLILGMSVILPLCRIQTENVTPVAEHMEEVETFIHDLSEYYVSTEVHSAPTVEETTILDTAVNKWNSVNVWLRFIIIAYVVGLVLAWFDYFRSFVSLFILIARGRRVHIDGLPRWVRVVESKVAVTPCSWMCWIILSPGEVSQAAVQHELTHIKFRHSLDLLFAEFTARMLWFLPIGWMLLQDLKDVHEYQVDRSILHSGIGREEYQELLITQVTAPNNMANRSFAVANSLILSSIKKRFAMMYKKPSSRKAALKALYILPCTLLALTVFARPTVINDIQQTLEQEQAVAPLLSPTPIVDKVTAEQPAEETVIAEPIEEMVEPVLEAEDELTMSDAIDKDTTRPYLVKYKDSEGTLSKIYPTLNIPKRAQGKELVKMVRLAIAQSMYQMQEDIKQISDPNARELAEEQRRKRHKEYAQLVAELEDQTQNNKFDVAYITIAGALEIESCLSEQERENSHFNSTTSTAQSAATTSDSEAQDRYRKAFEKGDFMVCGKDTVFVTRGVGENYKADDEHTYPIFENPITVPTSQLNIPDMAWHYTMDCSEHATRVIAVFHQPDHEWWFYRFSNKIAIIDADTQERYEMQNVLPYNSICCFWIRGAQNKNVRFDCVFPPLPKKVKRIQFDMHNSVHGMYPKNTDFNVVHKPSDVYKIKDLLRENGGVTVTQNLK